MDGASHLRQSGALACAFGDWTTPPLAQPAPMLELPRFLSDDDGPLALVAYDCHERRVAATSAPWSAAATAPFHWLEVRADEICRVDYHSGGDYAGSTFIAAVRFEVASEASPSLEVRPNTRAR